MKWALLVLCALSGLGCATTDSASAPSSGAALTFIENDYPAALAEARKRGVPLFADAWAPWCHTCKFMRSYVFSDPALGPQSSRFVWLSIDTEQPNNAAFVQHYPIEAWPTLMVIDPQQEKPVLTWLGSADVAQLVQLLGDGEAALKARDSTADSLSLADRLAAQGKGAQAVEVYQRLLDHAPPTWNERGRVLSSLVGTLQSSGNHKACAIQARTLAPAMARTAMFAAVVTSGLQCALDSDAPADWSQESLRVLEPLGQEALAIPNLLADDRSGVYGDPGRRAPADRRHGGGQDAGMAVAHVPGGRRRPRRQPPAALHLRRPSCGSRHCRWRSFPGHPCPGGQRARPT